VVTVGATDDAAGLVEVQTGLRVGERVLATSATTLPVGTPVTVADDAAGTAAPATPVAPATPDSTTPASPAQQPEES
jgi:hypothetical protein